MIEDHSLATYLKRSDETEIERFKRLLAFAKLNAGGEQGGFWSLERDRLEKLIRDSK